MDLQIIPDRDRPDTWRVEDTDYGGDGGCAIAVFIGPDAEKRAREYAEWLAATGLL